MSSSNSITKLRPTVPTALWGAGIGLVAGIALSFNWFGLGFGGVLAGTAEKMAAARADKVAVAAYTPTCVKLFLAQTDMPAHWAKFTENSWSRDSVVRAAGFATIPGEKSPNSAVGDACANALTAIAEKKPPQPQAKN